MRTVEKQKQFICHQCRKRTELSLRQVGSHKVHSFCNRGCRLQCLYDAGLLTKEEVQTLEGHIESSRW